MSRLAQGEKNPRTPTGQEPSVKAYNPLVEEPKLQDKWQKGQIYKFDTSDETRPTYSIDTPPPYPSGDFHVGNALNWCYFDFVARYQRMKGYNVHFPQGWDCHGLPTEVRAEQTHNVRKNDLPPAQFIEMCRKLTEDYIARMKKTIMRLGISTDWNLEYRTMDPSYYRLTQLSFIKLYEDGYLYRGEHPVNWCPRCETAIAEAEVEHQERQGTLYYMVFPLKQSKLEIASTRPELLPACVAIAVNPTDTRYKPLIGQAAKVPIFGNEVPVIGDDEADSSFGTGAVMVCTFGDKTDVRWQRKHGLPLVRALTEDGRLSVGDPRFNGLKVEEARKRIVETLQAEDRITRSESYKRSVGVCWRCKTPVEIISRPQWFMKTRNMTEDVVAWSENLRWVPEFARQRLIDWARSLDWDWVISRQRIFATPIPVWYCKECQAVLVPKSDQLPVDPRTDNAPMKNCPKCASGKLQGESDVLDTWMDSSITAAVHAGWPNEARRFEKLFPADLQPNGVDIIRTWDYYLLVRSLALFGKPPYKTVLVNGMVRGTDGRMMHKSYGNYVESGEAMSKYGADPLRQWAASGGGTGYDIPFRWTELDHARKFLTKLWNIARFVTTNAKEYLKTEPQGLTLLDRWLLGRLQETVIQVTNHYEDFQFNLALETVRDFAWHSLADDYLEAVKHRLSPEASLEDKKCVQFCLLRTLDTIIKLLAPISPHMTEIVYEQIPKPPGSPRSVHSSDWPDVDKKHLDEKAITDGKTLVDAIALSRRKKADSGISLKTPIKKLVIASGPDQIRVLRDNDSVILRTIKAESLVLEEAKDLRVEISV